MSSKFESEKYGGFSPSPVLDDVVEPTNPAPIDYGPMAPSLEERLAEAEAELAAYRSVEDIAQLELRELREKVARLEAAGPVEQDDSWKAELAAKDAEILRLKSQSTASNQQDGTAAYFANQLEAARATISTLEAELLNRPSIDPAEFESLKLESTRLNGQVTDLNEQIASLAADNKSLDNRLLDTLSELTALRAERNERDAEVRALQADLAQARNEASLMEELKAQLTQARVELDNFADIRTAKEELQHRASLLEAQLADAKSRVDQAESTVFEFAQMRANLKRHRALLADALAQVDDIVGPLDSDEA